MVQLGSVRILGVGRKASMLRTRAWAVRRLLLWRATNHGSLYPVDFLHFTDRLTVLLSELCTRRAPPWCYWKMAQERPRLKSSLETC